MSSSVKLGVVLSSGPGDVDGTSDVSMRSCSKLAVTTLHGRVWLGLDQLTLRISLGMEHPSPDTRVSKGRLLCVGLLKTFCGVACNVSQDNSDQVQL